jgi:hypothetical protein
MSPPSSGSKRKARSRSQAERGLVFEPEDWTSLFAVLLTGLHSVPFQKRELIIATAARASDSMERYYSHNPQTLCHSDRTKLESLKISDNRSSTKKKTSLRSKYSSQHPVLKHPHSMFLPQCQRPSFTPIRKHRQNYSFVYSNNVNGYASIYVASNDRMISELEGIRKEEVVTWTR